MLDALADTRTIICDLRLDLSRERELNKQLMRRLESGLSHDDDASERRTKHEEDIKRFSSANRELRYVVAQAENRIRLQQQEIVALRNQLPGQMQSAPQRYRDRTESSDSQFDYMDKASLTETPVLRTQPRFDMMETPQVASRHRAHSLGSIRLPATLLSPESISESVFEDHMDGPPNGQQTWLAANDGLSLEDERFLNNVRSCLLT